MPAGKYDLKIEQGATFSRTFTYVIDDDPVDLTGYTARMQIRSEPSSEEPLVDISSPTDITLGDEDGTVEVTIDADTTAELVPQRAYYDLEIESAGGIVERLLEGRVTISEQVTRA